MKIKIKALFSRLTALLLAVLILASVTVFTAVADSESEDVTEITVTDENALAKMSSGTDENAEANSDAEVDGGEMESDEEVGEEVDSSNEKTADNEAVADENSDEKNEKEEDVQYLTDEEELALCTLIAENDNLALYLHEEYERIGLYVKKSGKVYWSNCVNALLDDATTKSSLQQNRLANIAVKSGNATDLIISAYYYSWKQSTDKGNTTFELVDNGVKITYKYSTTAVAATIPVYYVLEDNCLVSYINTNEIVEPFGYVTGEDATESDTDVLVLTEIALNPFFAAAEPNVSGYMLIPDGSGARINLNNGKSGYTGYSSYIYGSDITTVKDLQPDETEKATMPVLAMVHGSDGLVMIASAGDTFATVNAEVSYNKDDNSMYNYCYFSFTLRSTDTYSMAGDSSSIMMFENGDGSIQVEKLEVRYYPITSSEEEVTYTEIADIYRNYLIEEEGLEKKTTSDYSPLFIDFFGGTLKSKSILGIPINMKTAFTTFDQAVEIVKELQELGVEDFVINYKDWTADSMTGKIDTGSSVASVLGGKSDFESMKNFLENTGAEFYASLGEYTFTSSGNGFWTLFNTAYRVSKSYSRQYTYNIAFGTPDSGVAAALLSPKSISKLSTKIAKNISKLGVSGVGLNDYANTLWSDYSNKNRTNRETTAQYIIEFYKTVAEACGKVIADSPNAYLLPYVDVIENLTLQSSQFKIADEDVPFVQIVLHGYIPYSSEAINSIADSKEYFLRALAAGSYIKYDFIYEKTTEIENTGYIKLFYANYNGWLEQAAGEYKLAREVLSGVSDSVITGYVQDGSVITTTYENGTVTTIDISTGVITVNGTTYNYSDYVDEGGLLNG